MIGVEVAERTLALPLVRLVEILADMVVLLCVAEEVGEDERSGEGAVATTGEGEDEGGGRREGEGGVCTEEDILEEWLCREYVRRVGAGVEVSLGAVGTRT